MKAISPPDCPHLSRCPGCPALTREPSYEVQLAHKRLRVVDAFSRFPELASVAIEATNGASELRAFRTRAKLSVGSHGEVGLFAADLASEADGARVVVDTRGCPILPPVLNRIADAVRDFARRPEGPIVTGLLGLDLRSAASRECENPTTDPDGVLVTFVIDPRQCSESALQPLLEAVREAGGTSLVGVAANLRDPRSPQFLGGRTIPLWGASKASDRVGLSRQQVTFGSFAQAHRGQAAKVQRSLLDAIVAPGFPRPRRVFELFGGSGAIGLSVAAAGIPVVLVEAFAPAAEAAQQEANERQLPLTAYAAEAAEFLQNGPPQAHASADDVFIVNPPRRGLPRAVREALLQIRPRTIAYVSCDPDTLARDVAPFVAAGYFCGSARPFDQIPLSDEVETVVVLRVGEKPAAQGTVNEGVFLRPQRSHDRAADVPRGSDGTGTRRLAPDASTSGIALYGAPLAIDAVHALVLVRGITHAKGRLAARNPNDRRGPELRAQYKRLAVLPFGRERGGHSLLAIKTEGWTPKQLFMQCAAIGHPVLGGAPLTSNGDPEGDATDRHFEERYTLDRPFMHLLKVAYRRVAPRDSSSEVPVTALPEEALAELPGDLLTVLARLEAPPDRIAQWVAATLAL